MPRRPTDRYAQFLPVNAKAIQDFKIHDNSTGNKPETVKTHKSLLIMFFQRLEPEKPFDTITLHDVEETLNYDGWKATSKEIIKRVLRQFFRYYNRPDIANGIVLNQKVTDAVTKTIEDCLTPDEITKLINATREPMYRALVETFLISGGRLGEIQSLTVGGIKFDRNTVWINIIDSKTDIRRVPVVTNDKNPTAFFPSNLEAWLLSHPERDNPKALLFYSRYRDKRYYGKQMSDCGVYDVLKRIAKEAGIKKQVHPHILRHTAATYDGQYLPEQMLCTKFGWKIGSAMARRYCHVNTNALQKVLLEQAGISKDDNPRSKELIENQQLRTKVDNLEKAFEKVLDMLENKNKEFIEQTKFEKEAYQEYRQQLANEADAINAQHPTEPL